MRVWVCTAREGSSVGPPPPDLFLLLVLGVVHPGLVRHVPGAQPQGTTVEPPATVTPVRTCETAPWGKIGDHVSALAAGWAPCQQY